MLNRHRFVTDEARDLWLTGDVRLSPADAQALAAQLELDYETVPICLACLTFVSFPLDLGDERRARRKALTVAPWLWEEGLEAPIRLALARAGERRVDRAAEALAEVEELGPRSEVVVAAVLRLARAQVEEMRSRRY